MAGCPAGFDLTTPPPEGSEAIDRNGDQYVCVKEMANWKRVVFDNGVPFQEDGCPAGLTLFQLPVYVPEDDPAAAADLNGDKRVCANGGGNLFTDNGAPPKV